MPSRQTQTRAEKVQPNRREPLPVTRAKAAPTSVASTSLAATNVGRWASAARAGGRATSAGHERAAAATRPALPQDGETPLPTLQPLLVPLAAIPTQPRWGGHVEATTGGPRPGPACGSCACVWGQRKARRACLVQEVAGEGVGEQKRRRAWRADPQHPHGASGGGPRTGGATTGSSVPSPRTLHQPPGAPGRIPPKGLRATQEANHP